jgi:hypothetical protein
MFAAAAAAAQLQQYQAAPQYQPGPQVRAPTTPVRSM